MRITTLLAVIPFLSAALPCSGELLLYEPFASEPGKIPAGWEADNFSTPNARAARDKNNDFVQAGSLSVPGLASSAGNSWKHDNSAYQYYRRNFADAPRSGETIYYSFILQLDDISGLSTTGSRSPLMGLSTGDATQMGNKVVASVGVSRNPDDETKFNLSVDGDFRGPSSAESLKVSGDYSVGQPIFIVVSYTAGTANFWINPEPSSFGAPTPPEPTLTDSTRRLNIQGFIVASSTSVSFQPNAWVMDELRIGTSWADVTPPAR